MFSLARRCGRGLTACVLATLFVVPCNLMAQTHVVSPAELQKQAVQTTESRESQLQSVNRLLSTPMAEKAMQSAHIDAVQVKTAVSTLSDEELAQMAKRADKAQTDFAAGMSDHDMILVILGIAVLVLLIVAVR